MPDPMLAVNQDAMVSARLRTMISESDQWRQRAISDYVVRHFAVACDMRKLLDLRQYGAASKDLDEAINHCEITLRQGFRQTFGHDMIAEEVG